jgi:hypothetical protein
MRLAPRDKYRFNSLDVIVWLINLQKDVLPFFASYLLQMPKN